MITMSIIQKIIVIPILRSQVRLYIFFGILFGFYQFISWIENQEIKMFGIGIIKGTIIGMSIGVMTGLALKEVCKMKKKKDQVSKTENDIVDEENSQYKYINNGFDEI